MVNNCAIKDCSSIGGRDKVSFFRLPAILTNQGEECHQLSERRRRLWISRINRADLMASSYPYTRVCSKHFVSGKPSMLYKVADIDWAPTLKLGHKKPLSSNPNLDSCDQTELSGVSISNMHSELEKLTMENTDLRNRLAQTNVSDECLLTRK